MSVQVEIEYPQNLKELSTSSDTEPLLIEYKGQQFGFQSFVRGNSTLFIVSIVVHNRAEYNHKYKERVVQRAVEIVNRCITRIRTFYHQNTNFQLVSPRTIKQVKITYTGNEGTESEFFPLIQEMPRYVKEFYDYLNEEEHYLSLGEKLEIDQLLYLHLIIDGYYSLYEGRFNDCIIHCATASESMVFPMLKLWFQEKLFNRSSSSAEEIVMEIPMSLKYELLFGTIEYEYLKSQGELLASMKRTNKLRNSIIHSGHSANKLEAETALNDTAKLIYLVHFKALLD